MPGADVLENKPPETETEELLTKWDLEQLLSAKLGPDTRVDSIATKQLTQPGENYGSNILSVEVTLLPDYKKLDLVAKLVPLSPFLREIFNCGVTVRTEIDVYTKVSKEFQEIQRENNISKKDYLDLFPRCYGARVSRNEDVGQLADEGAVILLENLTPLGYHCGDRITGVDLEHSEMAVSRLARFHATSIAIKIKKPSVFKEVIMKNLLPLTRNVGLATYLYSTTTTNFTDEITSRSTNSVPCPPPIHCHAPHSSYVHKNPPCEKH
uniref:Uncharacterized protein n=1 Tax=Timema genevievae TaxID=629358 RepID=A0A7R9K4G6_TIMGE|nr:unnamed protein product [Timema genevievae]